MVTIQADRTDRIQALAYRYADQPKEWVELCNLCVGNYFVQLCDRDRYGFTANAYACGRCGLVFLNPRLTGTAYSDFYARVYRPLVSAYHGRVIDAKSIQGEQGEYARERAEFAAPFLGRRPGGRLLDIGGSTGVVAQHFSQRFGYAGVVLDPSAEELREAKARGLSTIHGLFEGTDFGSEKFDLLLLCQTIDHLLDISVTLTKVRECLTEGGIFFFDIVDLRAAYLRHWNINEVIKIDHPYYLTQETTEAFLRQKGFTVLRKGYAADRLHISYVCASIAPDSGHLPSPESVELLLREIRTVQNAPRGMAL
ncbi:MAG: class I SAM-dependent methyltransferase [Anaerolineales bacterium]